MGVMSLGVGKDAEITIYADGSDEQDAIQAISEVLSKEGLTEYMSKLIKGIAASDGVAIAKTYLLVEPDLSFTNEKITDTDAEIKVQKCFRSFQN